MSRFIKGNLKRKTLLTFTTILLIGLICTSCHKSDLLTNTQVYKQDESFFKRNDSLAGVFQNINGTLTDNSLLNKMITGFKNYDKQNKIAEKIKSKFGKPAWDISVLFKNDNGYKTIVVPIVNTENLISSLAFFYQTGDNEFLYKLVDRNAPQTRLEKNGNKEATKFTQATLKGLFGISDKNYHTAKNLNSIRSSTTTTNGITAFSVTVYYQCFSYTYVTDGYNSVTTIQCNYSIIFDYMTLANLVDGSGGGGSFSGDGGGSGSSTPTIIITSDTSITNYPNVKCVFDSLMKSILPNILSAFLGNQYNIIFILGNLSDSINGMTVPTNSTGTNFRVTINYKIATDPYYSRIWLAKTFIHEAFHAKLRQKAFELLGTDVISKWPKNIDDMTLRELSIYFYDYTSQNGTWNIIGHQWMIENIETCASYLRDFIQQFYPFIYVDAGSDLKNYIALFYQGLEDVPCYSGDIIARGFITNCTIGENCLGYIQNRIFNINSCPQ